MKYRCLQKEKFQKNEYSIVPIRFEDRIEIMNWRNEQIYHLRQSKPLTEADQNHYFQNIVAKLFEQKQPGQVLFSYLENDTCIGYGGLVHINWTDQNAEISFIMDTTLEKEHFHFHWQTYLELLEKVAFEELGLHKIYTYAFDLRPHLYVALESSGFQKEAVLKEHCIFNNSLKDVVIHSKFNDFYLRKADSEDAEMLFKWVNCPDVRNNAFSSDVIVWDEHQKWFKAKLQDCNSSIFILNFKNSFVGQIRFDFDCSLNSYVIDYSIDSKFRGLGYGYKIIKMGLQEMGTGKYTAKVKFDNLASIKVFEKLSFKCFEKENYLEFVLVK
jgi:RimJ/RimL family protein N-acetyltransferase